MEKYRKNVAIIVLFLLPAFIIYAVLEVIPIIQTIYFSFFKWSGIGGVPLQYAGLQNFVDLFGFKGFWLSMKNIAWYIAISLVTQIPVGYLLAILLSTSCKGYKIFKTFFFSPLILSITAVGLMWYFMLYPNTGVLSNMLTAVGLQDWTRNWLIDKDTALNSLILITAWISSGIYMIIAFAAITAIPGEIIEASIIDGAGEIRKIISITIPMIWESIKISIVMVITGVLKIFEIVFVMTQGGPNGLTEVPVSLMYYEAFKYNHYGRGSAIAVIVFFLSIFLTVASLKLMQRDKLEY